MPLGWISALSRRIAQLWKRRVSIKLIPLLSTIEGVGIAIAVLSLWGFSGIADGILEQEAFAFDTAILLALHRLQTPLLDQAMIGVTFLGQPTPLVLITLGLGLSLMLRRQLAEGVILAIAAVGAASLNLVLKDVFARARPELWERIIDVRYYSFPSGHAMTSVVIYGLIGYLVATTWKQQSGWIISATVFLTALIGFSRLYLGVHWPTDIVAGYAAGLVWLVACILTLEVWRGKAFQRRHSLSS